jgi:segregation and condensation protein B
MEIKELEAVIEALLFATGDVLPLDKIAEAIDVDKKTTRSIIGNMMIYYQGANRGIMIREINSGYQLCTRPEYFEYIKKLNEPRQKQGLSQAAFEALAIIAYNQPITRTRVEQIRGVNSDSAVTRLVDRNLVREAGRLDAPGRPILYETTEEFLRSFGFKAIQDLPILEGDVLEALDESRLNMQPSAVPAEEHNG